MKTIAFSHIGTRSNNEDRLGYNKDSFVVCDGMGGYANGEIASKFVVDEVLQLIEKKPLKITKETITEILETVQQNLNKKLETQPELLKMGTTFTGVFFTKKSIYVAHIGDSRVYVVRPAEEKIWHTWDHSLVGGLMQSGEITREKGRLHPMSNRISKAITANDNNKIVTADIVKFDAVKKGDLFFLCSDGVNEAWPEHQLLALLCDVEKSSEAKLKQIEQQCAQESRDNNTAILIEIQADDSLGVDGNNDAVDWLTLNNFNEDYELYLEDIKQEDDEEEFIIETEEVTNTTKNSYFSSFTKRKIMYAVIVVIIVLVLIIFR